MNKPLFFFFFAKNEFLRNDLSLDIKQRNYRHARQR